MRSSRKLTPAAQSAELTPEDYSEPLEAATVFGRSAPLEVDLGCGDGSFLSELAEQVPERNFLGIERLLGRVRSACKKIAARHLTNARILQMDIRHAVQHIIPPGSVEVFYLMFPDPWPKRRHQRRRVLTQDLLQSIATALKPAGLLRITTDQRDYAEEMQRKLILASALEIQPQDDGNSAPFPSSRFEEHFRARGVPIYRLVARRGSPDR